jgi:hypothetical protein
VVPSNFATRADKKVCGESDEVAAAPPCVATAIAYLSWGAPPPLQCRTFMRREWNHVPCECRVRL